MRAYFFFRVYIEKIVKRENRGSLFIKRICTCCVSFYRNNRSFGYFRRGCFFFSSKLGSFYQKLTCVFFNPYRISSLLTYTNPRIQPRTTHFLLIKNFEIFLIPIGTFRFIALYVLSLKFK